MHANGKVDFIIVGAQKGGTTALASFLAQHPGIFILEIKEAHFFDITRKYYDSKARSAPYGDYHRLFARAKPNQLWGEATPSYMFLPFVPRRIHEYNPAVKIIFLLRDPVMRAFSHFSMQRSRRWETHSFAAAVAMEFVRVHLFWASQTALDTRSGSTVMSRVVSMANRLPDFCGSSRGKIVSF
jgi:hypothetical protein